MSFKSLKKEFDILSKNVSKNKKNTEEKNTVVNASAEMAGASADALNASAEDGDDRAFCGHCTTVVNDGVCCNFCFKWFHFENECSGLMNIKNLKEFMSSMNILYVCDKCSPDTQELKGCPRPVTSNEIDKKSVEVMTHVEKVVHQSSDVLLNKIAMLSDLVCENNDKIKMMETALDDNLLTKRGHSYADMLKTKNVLVVKSSQENDKAVDKKKSIMSDIKAPVDSIKSTKDGHLVVNFTNKKDLEDAKKQLESSRDKHEVTVNEKNKMKPKIKVVNVTKDDDDVISSILGKSPWLANLMDNEDDFKLLKEFEAKERTMKHCIIRCSPKIRKAIHDRDDRLCMLYQTCKVYNTFPVFQCYKCQGFKHSAEKCTKSQCCAKCGGGHRLKDCVANNTKCINCANHGHSETNHKSFDPVCPCYQEEVSRIKNNTDYGFEL